MNQACLNYQKLDGDKVRCHTCHHFCMIAPGKVGICGVRQNQKGKLCLLVYQKTTGVQIDPIEKKPLFHFLPGSLAASFGTLGCNFRCLNCHNGFYSQMYGLKGQIENYQDINWGESIKPKEIIKIALETGCRSIAYTYNEPTIFVEYALKTMKLARKKGLKNIWVSNGYMSEKTLGLIIPYLNAINIDIKSYEESFYQKICGAKLMPVLKNCQKFVHAGIWLEVTTLLIPGYSDDLAMLRKLASFIKTKLGEEVPWHVTGFSGSISWKMQEVEDTKIEKIEAAYKIGKSVGLKYVYAGNISDQNLENTYCPKCGQLIIKRSGYLIERYDKKGNCPKCQTKILGVWIGL